MRKILYIINPISGVGKQKIVEKMLEKYSSKNSQYEIIYTKKAKHAIEIAKENLFNFDAIIAVGGDGSVNEVAQALINTNTVFGIIPTGSGNGLARHLKIPLKIEAAIKNINKFNTTIIDTASINEKYFVNVAGIGFDALIAHKFANYGKRGFLSYIKLVSKEFKNYKPQKIKININNNSAEISMFLLSIANGSQFGNNAYIAPKASLTDGFLELVQLKKFAIKNAPKLAYKLFRRSIETSKFIETSAIKNIIIEKNGEILAHIDGEPAIFTNKIEIKIIPKSLKIIVPWKVLQAIIILVHIAKLLKPL